MGVIPAKVVKLEWTKQKSPPRLGALLRHTDGSYYKVTKIEVTVLQLP